MDNKVKAAFEQIHADDSLKDNTRTAIYHHMESFGKTRQRSVRRFATAAACILTLVLAAGGYFSYTIPAAAIGIDVNPSVELQVNIYGKVIDVKGYNADGVALADELSVNHSNYADAVNSILDNEPIKSCIASDELLEITVTSGWEKNAEKMRECISDETGIDIENIYCMVDQAEVEEAHLAGISFGKYRAYLELHEMNPEITVDDIRDLTMREIRDMIEEQSGANSSSADYGKGQGNGKGSGRENGQGNGQGNGQKNGQGNANENGTAKGQKDRKQ